MFRDRYPTAAHAHGRGRIQYNVSVRPIALTIAFFRHCQRYDTHSHIRHLCQNAGLLLQRKRNIAKAGDGTRDITLPPRSSAV